MAHEKKEDGEAKHTYAWHLSKLLYLSWQIIMQAISFELQGLCTLIYVGSLEGSSNIGAATLGNSLCNISGFSLAYGLTAALDTLIPQSFGSKQYLLLGLHAQRAILILTLCVIPTAFIWLYAASILEHVLFIPHDVALQAGRWSRTLTLGLWPSIVYECLRKFCQGQGLIYPAVLATTLGLVFNIVANYYLVPLLGFEGAALVVALTQWFHLIALVIILLVRRQQMLAGRTEKVLAASSHGLLSPLEMTNSSSSNNTACEAKQQDDPEDNWPEPSFDLFRDWYLFLSLGIPAAASLFVEWGSFELAASIAGQIDTVSLSAHGIYMSTAGLFYMCPQAIAIATAVQAGTVIGAGNADEAGKVVALGVMLDTIWGLFAGFLLLFVLREHWGPLFTKDEATRNMVFACMPIMVLYVMTDATKCITLNVLRSSGNPSVTFFVNVGVCLCILLPLGYYLSITRGWGLWGLWLSMSISWGMATIIFGIILLRTNWKDLLVVGGVEDAEKEKEGKKEKGKESEGEERASVEMVTDTTGKARSCSV